MISRVVIKNFKSIGDSGVDLELKPLTLLVGPNGGGKSSILEAIAVASQRHFTSRLTQFPSWVSMTHRQNGSTALIEVYPDSVDDSPKSNVLVKFQNRGLPPERARKIDLESGEGPKRDLGPELKEKTFLLSAVRGNVPFDTSTIPEEGQPEWVGSHGENLLFILGIILGQARHKRTTDKIKSWSSRFGVSELQAGLRGRGRAGSDFHDSESKTALDLGLASTGARQILTVITQLFWSPEGSLLLIEEPEISLHPKAQIDVLEMFGEAIHEGNRQIITSTHSVFMLQALGYAVLKGGLTPDQMAVYHVEKGKEGTTATLLPLSEKGYIQDWVPSFNEVERHLLLEWAKSLPRE